VTAPLSGVMSTQCVFCGWLWKGTPNPIEQRCGECEDRWQHARDLTLAPFRENILEAAKAWHGAPIYSRIPLRAALHQAVGELKAAETIADAVLLPVRVNCVYPYPQVKT
jgi:hypothetical protein